jgi:hypothetical protein
MRLIWTWVLCLLLAACARDPIDTPGTWKAPPKGLTSNDENLRAMVVNPRDLVVGTGDSTGEGVTAARAARRELSGRRAPLLNGNVSLPNGGSQPSQGGQQGGGASTGGAPLDSE